ncbi:hypothetical protein CEP53_009637 [Fusarium sp. AF-6]|nr:hypothetical protein CEP53_009637 [Fusarium sp. AF-6]
MSSHVDFREPAGLAVTDIGHGGDHFQRVEKTLLESGVADEMENDKDDEDDEKDPTPDESDHDTSYPEDSREVLTNLDTRHENLGVGNSVHTLRRMSMWEYLFLDSLKGFLQKCTWRSD